MLRTPKNPFIQIIIFIAVFLVIALAESLVSAFVVAPELLLLSLKTFLLLKMCIMDILILVQQ